MAHRSTHRSRQGFHGRGALGFAASACLVGVLACGAQDQGADSSRSEATSEMASEQAAGGADVAAQAATSMADQTQIEETGFIYKDLTVASESARAGEGQTITMKGTPLVLKGQEIKVGDRLPTAMLVSSGLEPTSLTDGQGHVRIVSVVPALMTATCEQQTHYLSEKNGGLEDQIELVTVSMDSPELQTEFAEKAKIENVTFLSDEKEAAFGNGVGLLIEKPRILARAVMVVDSENVVRYLQVVPELTSMPDMEAAFDFARGLVSEAS